MAPPVPGQQVRNPFALAAYACGIVGLVLSLGTLSLPSLAPIILRAVSLSRIRRSGGQLSGRDAARTGLILGTVGLAVAALLLALFSVALNRLRLDSW